jgi:hypothetical protein
MQAIVDCEGKLTGETKMIGANTLQGSAELKEALAKPPNGWDCIEGEDCIEEGDWVTYDGCKFYADGQLVLDATDMTDAQAARAAGRIMRAGGFFPNIWAISDHGNIAVFTFE